MLVLCMVVLHKTAIETRITLFIKGQGGSASSLLIQFTYKAQKPPVVKESDNSLMVKLLICNQTL